MDNEEQTIHPVVSGYNFTKDWFSQAAEVWKHLIPLLPGKPGERNFLEIGSFEGRSAVWVMENMLQKDDWITCVDTWDGGEEHDDATMNGAFERFRENMDRAVMRNPGAYYGWLRQDSVSAMAEILHKEGDGRFHFIYIDGSHVAHDVLTDACMAWALLKDGGIMVLDDYVWGDPRDILHRPKLAIDAFTNIFAEELELIHTQYQCIVRKRRAK